MAMSYPRAVSVPRSALVLLTVIALRTAEGEGAAPVGDSGPAGAHAHHHPVAPGFTQTRVAYTVPEVTLVDRHGGEVPLRELLDTDRPTLLNFIYISCPAICPVMSATFAQVQRRLGDDAERVRMVSVSIDPEHDRPAALRDYARRFGAGPQWRFLTGTLEDSIAVQQAFGTYRGDKRRANSPPELWSSG